LAQHARRPAGRDDLPPEVPQPAREIDQTPLVRNTQYPPPHRPTPSPGFRYQPNPSARRTSRASGAFPSTNVNVVESGTRNAPTSPPDALLPASASTTTG